IDFREPDDGACLARLRSLAGTVPQSAGCVTSAQTHKGRRGAPAQWPDGTSAQSLDAPGAPGRPVEDLYDLFPTDPQQTYEVRDVLDCILDAGSFQEYKAEYGQTIVCGYARLGGFAVGVVANQHHPVKTGAGELQLGGVIYHDSADKAARFVMDCNQTWTPLVFFQDVYGFMVGRDSEQAGIIRAGAKLVNVIANSRVPKLTVITGGSFGAGNYAMCGKAFDPRFLFAWPTARYAVMGSRQAAATLLDVNIAALRRDGRTPDAEELEELRRKVEASYEDQTDIRYAAARGWLDEIIEPAQTRGALLTALEIATRHTEDEPFRTGVLQV
ncbi:MAG TPA: carboxyl transferase domain-containing protein, partial [Planctomycetaceae bacterium]|nr:carboxyl transferase domain-containing protein [Planctomycetaceae bacterium]